MAVPDLYAVLGVARFAPERTVRSAYIALMARHHPDRSAPAGHDPLLLHRINAAYWELRHPERRSAYDVRLSADVRRAGELRRMRRRAARDALRWRRFTRPARRTPLLFMATLIAVTGAIYGAREHRHRLPRPAAEAGVADASTLSTAIAGTSTLNTALAGEPMVRAAIDDYAALRARAGPAGVVAYIDRCFGELVTAATQLGFDHCVAMDALAARDHMLGDEAAQFTRERRLARLSRVAMPPAAALLARWDVIEQLIDGHTRIAANRFR